MKGTEEGTESKIRRFAGPTHGQESIGEAPHLVHRAIAQGGEDFIAVAEAKAGRVLDEVFDVWLYGQQVPA